MAALVIRSPGVSKPLALIFHGGPGIRSDIHDIALRRTDEMALLSRWEHAV